MKHKHCYRLLLSCLFVVVLSGCGGATVEALVTTPVATQENVADLSLADDLSVDEVADLWQQGAIKIVDVREQDEYDAGHIPGAILIPLEFVVDRQDEVPTDTQVVVVCRSGRRSGLAFDLLRDAGFDNVHNMTGGMSAWEAAGYDLEP